MRMAQFKNDLMNQRFGRLVAMHIDPSPSSRTKWVCKCDCGETFSAMRSNLLGGGSTSCGCSKATHGHSRKGKMSPTMSSWSAMMSRCRDANSPSFKHYNSRGITVCRRWAEGEDGLSGFSCFLEDMGVRPSLEYSIERVDNDLGYYPANCEWASRKAQALNRTTTRFFLHEGKKKTIEDLSEQTGITQDSLRWRLTRKNIPLEIALSLPVQKGLRFSRAVPLVMVDFNGEKLTLRQVSEKTGVPLTTVKWRHKNNRPLV